MVLRRSADSLCLTALELLRLPAISRERLRESVALEHGERLQAALAAGRGVIVVSAHLGNWEWLAARLAQEVPEFHAVARTVRNMGAAEVVNAARASHGVHVVPLQDMRRMLRVLQDGGVLGLVADVQAVGRGALVDFLGRPAWTFTGVAALATRTGAQVLPIFCPRQPDGTYLAQVGEAIPMADTADRQADLLTNTARLNASIGAAVRAYPEQWIWLHNRWKTPRDAVTAEPAE